MRGSRHVKYQKARVYIGLGQLQMALSELKKVTQLAPNEATVHYDMGKLYKKLNMPQSAMLCFLRALDLKPHNPDFNQIKNALDQLHGNSESGSDDSGSEED
eukprot:g61510.t1